MQFALKARSLAALTMLTTLAVGAADQFPLLHAGDYSYTNVTVTSVTPTDLYFSHAGGMGNVKLKDLDAALQEHFKYNATNAENIARAQAEASRRYYMAKAAEKPPVIVPKPEEEVVVESPPTNRPPGLRLETVKARRFLGTPAPQLEVEKWLTETPATSGKFVLLDFWATWCDQATIPKLNAMQEKFNDRLVIVALSDESESAVRLMTSPRLNFSVAIDTKTRTKREVQVLIIPHAMLMDPKGIVRFEGNPQELSETDLQQLLTTYAN
jgi:cytochrome c biogenesis protein CcmG, thiol:disulfide interchange protein DsbE